MLNTLKKYFINNSLRRDVLQIYIIQFFTLGFSLIGNVLIARSLGPAGKGIIDLFGLLNSFILELGLFGAASGLLYYLANQKKNVGKVHGTGLVLAISIGICTAFIGWATLPYVRSAFLGLTDWMILLAFFLSPFAYYRLIWSNIMTGINMAVLSYNIGFYFSSISVLSIILLWVLNELNVENIIIVTAVLLAANSFYSFFSLYKRESALDFNIELARDSIKYGFIIYIGIIANAFHFKFDQIMVSHYLGAEALGIYTVSVRWAEMLFLLDGAINSAALYKITSACRNEAYVLTRRLFKVQLIVSGIAGLVLAVLASPLIFYLYGKEYQEAILPLILLIPGIIAWSVAKIMSGMLTYNEKKGLYVTRIALLGCVLNVILNYVSINAFEMGIIGIAISSSISYGMVSTLILIKTIFAK